MQFLCQIKYRTFKKQYPVFIATYYRIFFKKVKLKDSLEKFLFIQDSVIFTQKENLFHN